MTLSFSSISETAIAELPFARAVADLEVELFTDISVAKNLPVDTGALVLNNANDEIYAVYYGGNRTAWSAELSAAAADTVQQVFNFVDSVDLNLSAVAAVSTLLNSIDAVALDIESSVATITVSQTSAVGFLETAADSVDIYSALVNDPALLSIDGEFFHNLKLFSNETGSLQFEVVEQLFADDEPTESWRPRPGLPIGPISFNAISSEQSEGPLAKSFLFTETLQATLGSETITSTRLNYVDTGVVVLSGVSTELQIYKFVEQGNLTTVSITDQVVFLNSNESANLEIAAQDQIQQIFEFFEIAEISLDTETITSTTLNDFSSAELTVQSDPIVSVVLNYRDIYELVTNIQVAESKLSNYVDSMSLTAEPNDLISMRYFSFEPSVMTISAKTFAKEYTFLQQEFAIDLYELKLSAESSESFRSGVGAAIRNRQFWIG